MSERGERLKPNMDWREMGVREKEEREREFETEKRGKEVSEEDSGYGV